MSPLNEEVSLRATNLGPLPLRKARAVKGTYRHARDLAKLAPPPLDDGTFASRSQGLKDDL